MEKEKGEEQSDMSNKQQHDDPVKEQGIKTTEDNNKEQNSRNDHKEQEDINENDFRCGYFGWRPDCLQKLNKPAWLLVTVMILTFTQGFVVNGIVNVNLTTLERRYQLSSGQVAWIPSSYDIGAGLLALIFGYLGTFIHKVRMIALSALCQGFACFLWVLPHIISDTYEAGRKDTDLCDIDGNSSTCGSDSSAGGGAYLSVFILAQLLLSVGGSALYTLSVPLLDENVHRKNSAFYIGCMMSCSVLGPGIGLIVGGLFLQIYVDVGRVDMNDISITPADPRWIGAWWIGFVYSGFASILAALLLACFPRELPSAREYKADRISEAYAGRGEAETASSEFGRRPKDLLFSLKTLACNPYYILSTAAGCLEYGLILGFAAYLPKILQFQFSQSPSMAAVWAGVVVVPAATFGHIIGGVIARCLKLRMRGLIMQTIVFNGITILLIFQFLLKCDMLKIAGISVSYDNSTLDLDMDNPDVDHPCNANCSCSTVSYDPVCAHNDVTYFTPCHAGCTDSNGTEGYYNCSCIALDSTIDPSFPAAEKGVCSQECPVFPAFLVLFFLLNVCTFIPLTAGQATTMRCVPDKQRAFAYGIQNTVVRYLGNVPGPLLFGTIFDSSCWLWQETCDGPGACWIYNVDNVAYGILYLGLVFKTVSFLISILAFILYKPPPTQEDDTVVVEVNLQETDNYTEGNNSVSQSSDAKTNGIGSKANGANADLNSTTYSGQMGDISENDIKRCTIVDTAENTTGTRLPDCHLGTERTNVKTTPDKTATTSFTNTTFSTEEDDEVGLSTKL